MNKKEYPTELSRYFDKINRLYETSDQDRKDLITNKLEKLVDCLTNGEYDNNRAREIRENLGLSQKALAKKIGITKGMLITLESNYQGNQIISRRTRENKNMKGKFFYWLAEQGYDPFGLLN